MIPRPVRTLFLPAKFLTRSKNTKSGAQKLRFVITLLSFPCKYAVRRTQTRESSHEIIGSSPIMTVHFVIARRDRAIPPYSYFHSLAGAMPDNDSPSAVIPVHRHGNLCIEIIGSSPIMTVHFVIARRDRAIPPTHTSIRLPLAGWKSSCCRFRLFRIVPQGFPARPQRRL